MLRKSRKFPVPSAGLILTLVLLAQSPVPCLGRGQGESSKIVTAGSTGGDVIGADSVAIQQAIDRVAAAGGGTVVIKAGTYRIANTVRLSSHIRLRGEGPGKTLLMKIAGVRSNLQLDADYGEMTATVEDARGFAPGMGVTVLDSVSPEGWTPSILTIGSIQGNTLRFDGILHMDYSVANQGRVVNTFPLVAGFNVEDAQVEGLSLDGSRAGSGVVDGRQTAAIYFYRSRRVTIRNCEARNYPGDGISLQWVEDPVVDNCEAEGNATMGIHLGTGALRGIVRDSRAHDNGQDGLHLGGRVQFARYERNTSWNNGRDGISLGHKDTDNMFIGNSSSGNARAGIYFRDEVAANAANRNTFQTSTLEDNGRPGEPGYAVRIDGETRDLKFVSNTIRSHRINGVVAQPVGFYLGPGTDGITADQNLFIGEVQKAIIDESQGSHNQLATPLGR